MATTGTKVPAIKNIPANTERELKSTLESMKEAQEIRLGRRGDPRDRNVTLRELIDSGLAKQIKENPFNPNAGAGALDFTANTPLENLAVPPAPVGLEASGAFTAIILNWNGMSASAPYGNHAYTEIWRSRANNIGGATLRATTTAFIYTDEVGYGETYYYWVRYVSTSNVPGPYNNTNGVEASTIEDIAAVMQELSEDLSSLPGYQTLIADEFSEIASDLTTLDSAVTSINSSVASLESDVSSLETSVSNLSTETTRVIRSTSAPTQRDDASSLQGSDVWIDTDDNNQVYVRNAANTAWVKSRDSSLVTLVGTSSFTGSDLTSAMASAQSDIITATNTNTSQATAITNLQSDLSTAEGDITTNASAISSLGTRVTTAEGNITSITSDVTTLQSDLTTAQGDITTNASAISGLQTQITSNDGDITTLTSDVTELESTLTGYSSSSTVASAISGLQTQITANDGDITTITSDVTALESTLTGYSASSTVASAISGLQTQITANDGDITTINSDITALEATLTGYNSSSTVASAISGLQTQITANDGDITTINSDITALEATLTGYSSSSTVASAISGLQTQITANDGDITSLSSSVTSLTSDLSTAEGNISSNASAISSLQTTVTSQGNSISSNASAITSLQSTTGTNSASITSLQTATTNLQNDANASYVLKVEANGSVSGMVLEANASGAGAGSAVQFVSDKFAIWNGSSGTAPFIVSGGVVYIDNARIQNGAITNAKILDGTIQTAKIGDAQITTAKIGDLQVTNAKIADATIQTAKIQDAAITNAKINDLDAGKINAGTISADRIGANTITADKINVTDLALEFTAATVSGTTIGYWNNNTMRLKKVADIGTAPGIYHIFCRVFGGTGQVKTLSVVAGDGTFGGVGNELRNDIAYSDALFATDLPIADQGYAQFNSGQAQTWSGIDRFDSTYKMVQKDFIVRKVSSTSRTLALYILAQGDGNVRYLSNVQYGVYKFSEI